MPDDMKEHDILEKVSSPEGTYHGVCRGKWD